LPWSFEDVELLDGTVGGGHARAPLRQIQGFPGAE